MASPSTLPLTSAFPSPSPSRRLAASRRATSLVIVAQGKVKKYRQVGSPFPLTTCHYTCSVPVVQASRVVDSFRASCLDQSPSRLLFNLCAQLRHQLVSHTCNLTMWHRTRPVRFHLLILCIYYLPALSITWNLLFFP